MSSSQISIVAPDYTRDYRTNVNLEYWYGCIEPGTKEKEVQAWWENFLWTEFPSNEGWSTVTKYQQGETEPDNRTMKIGRVHEVKRLAERTPRSAFDKVVTKQLDKHMAGSENPPGSELIGAVGIGKHVVFYQRTLPDGNIQHLHQNPLHLWEDYGHVQAFVNMIKAQTLAAIERASQPAPVVLAASSSGETPSDVAPSTFTNYPTKFFYVIEGKYFLTDDGHVTNCTQRPDNVWIYNANGWKDTNRTQNWRMVVDGNISYS